MSTAEDITEDAIFHGALTLLQRRDGYRFTEDAVLLAAFASRGGRARIAADLGAGCGVVGLMLLHVGAAERVVAVELQDRLSRLVAENAGRNDLSRSILPLEADLRRAPIATGTLDLVVSNPPYVPAGSGHPPRGRERSLARHELCCSPLTLAAESARCLAPGGRVAVVYPAGREDEVTAALVDSGLEPCRRRWVHHAAGRGPVLLLIEARRGPAGACVEEPALHTRDASGAHGREMQRLVAGDFEAWAATCDEGRP